VSDYEEAKELATLKAQVGLLLKDSDGADDSRREIFQRIGALERRMSQVLVIAIVLCTVLPVAVESIVHHVRSTVTPAHVRR
jgi:hypothetical protein